MRRLNMHSRRPFFFSFRVWGQGREFFEFFLFTMCSHCVPIKFADSSQCVPQYDPNSTTLFIQYTLAKVELSSI
jgi:hypothetical protein